MAGGRALRRRPVPAYRIDHHTEYAYAATVSTSQHVAYLEPRTLPRQRVIAHTLTTDPPAAGMTRRIDYFGNAAAGRVTESRC